MNQTSTLRGITCGDYEKAVTQAVKKVEVVLNQPRQALAQAIADEGYSVAT